MSSNRARCPDCKNEFRPATLKKHGGVCGKCRKNQRTQGEAGEEKDEFDPFREELRWRYQKGPGKTVVIRTQDQAHGGFYCSPSLFEFCPRILTTVEEAQKEDPKELIELEIPMISPGSLDILSHPLHVALSILSRGPFIALHPVEQFSVGPKTHSMAYSLTVQVIWTLNWLGYDVGFLGKVVALLGVKRAGVRPNLPPWCFYHDTTTMVNDSRLLETSAPFIQKEGRAKFHAAMKTYWDTLTPHERAKTVDRLHPDTVKALLLLE
jgi:hypothetical protein